MRQLLIASPRKQRRMNPVKGKRKRKKAKAVKVVKTTRKRKKAVMMNCKIRNKQNKKEKILDRYYSLV